MKKNHMQYLFMLNTASFGASWPLEPWSKESRWGSLMKRDTKLYQRITDIAFKSKDGSSWKPSWFERHYLPKQTLEDWISKEEYAL